ncbi:hypothetical protein GIB67_039233 [Kingdonia uniflora]|uniref:Uncharacterized protein n=1 Tax=Kingdonia uniflora TaxID=39325 RepID=A0A7J7MM81_9MAGN|nr:hypothetical protein GIB67_039233 [Kingdonia uniflora]
MGLEISEPLLVVEFDKKKIIIDEEEVIPPWQDQITIRGLVASLILGTLFCVITHKLNLTIGIIPSLNVAAGLLGFFFIKSWTAFLSKLGFSTTPFTRQENTVIQTCVVACYGLAFSGGFGSYMIAMNDKTYKLIGVDYPGNRVEDVKNPSLGWMMGFMFVVSFLGLFSLVPLRKVMVIDYKLTYPSGTATAMLINSFHTNSGAELAGKQVSCLGKYLSISFFWSFFKWFFSGVGDSCGFDNFPSLGLLAFKNTFYFDFSPTYIGCGLICPHIVNCSVLFGAIISWGFLWPFIAQQAGDWYRADLGSSDFKGLYGYKQFIMGKASGRKAAKKPTQSERLASLEDANTLMVNKMGAMMTVILTLSTKNPSVEKEQSEGVHDNVESVTRGRGRGLPMGAFMRDSRNARINPTSPTPLRVVGRGKETIFPQIRPEILDSDNEQRGT